MVRPRQRFNSVVLKLSGEPFCTKAGPRIDPDELELVPREIKSSVDFVRRLAVVVGGGNIIRGARLAEAGQIPRATADYMGMLGTVINGVALKEMLGSLGQPSRCMTAIDIPAVAEPFIRGRALRHQEKGAVVILAGGTGNPFFTTDTCAALRATELECDVVLKATKVDGVYDADPKSNPNARRYESLTFAAAISKRLAVMDMTALAMCQEQNLPVIVFDFKKQGNIRKAIEGEPIGTLIHNG